jgi:hypothetical protein
MDALIKEKRSSFAPFEETFFITDAGRSPVAEMLAWLCRPGCDHLNRLDN